MATVEKFGKHPESGRTMFLLELDSLEDWPEELKLARSRHFVLFLAMDATEMGEDEIGAFTRKAVEQGMVYLSAWGPGSETVHDLFDDVDAEMNPDSDADSVILSEWHEGEPLSEALRFAVASAAPASDYEGTCRATLAVSVGNPDWAASVREWLEDPEKLDAAAEEGEDVAEGQREGEEEEGAAADDDLDLDDEEEEEEPEDEDDDEGYGEDDED